MSAAAKKQLEAVAAKKTEIANVSSELRQIEAQQTEITRDQERLRQNINSLNRVQGQQAQVNRYAAELASQGHRAGPTARPSERTAQAPGGAAVGIERPHGEARVLRVALAGYGNVARAFARLLAAQRAVYPFRIVAVHTAHHGTAYDLKGLPIEPLFGPSAGSIDEFLTRARAEVFLELTPLAPDTGEPATSYIRAAFAQGLHVVTANKGPVAFAYAELQEEERAAPAWSSASRPSPWTARRSTTWCATTCPA